MSKDQVPKHTVVLTLARGIPRIPDLMCREDLRGMAELPPLRLLTAQDCPAILGPDSSWVCSLREVN